MILKKKTTENENKKCKPKTKKRKISFLINELCPEGTNWESS